MDELLALLAIDAELLAYLHVVVAALVAVGWRIGRVALSTGVPAIGPSVLHTTPFARRAATTPVRGGTTERGPPSRV